MRICVNNKQEYTSINQFILLGHFCFQVCSASNKQNIPDDASDQSLTQVECIYIYSCVLHAREQPLLTLLTFSFLYLLFLLFSHTFPPPPPHPLFPPLLPHFLLFFFSYFIFPPSFLLLLPPSSLIPPPPLPPPVLIRR